MNTKNIVLSSFFLITALLTEGQNINWTSSRPDGHAPISIMGDHYHKKGEIMFSYRYMPMWMDGNLSSSKNIDDENIFQNYMVAPQKMEMNMHMLGIMYAPLDNLTLMLMANYISNTMDLKTKMGADFSTKSDGFGDLSVSGLIKIVNKNRQSLHANIGLSIPTGNIDQRGDTPMMDNAQLAYPMQLGSGTFDPFLGVTYLGQIKVISWGIQPKYKFRIGENSAKYSLGNRLDLTCWGAVKVSNYLSFSASLNYCIIEKIDGADVDMNPMMMPLYNTNNSGRNQLDLGVGGNFYIPSGNFKNVRVGLEIKHPLIQEVNGIQMKEKLIGVLGLQYSFGHHD